MTFSKKQTFRLPGVPCLFASIFSECWALTVYWVVNDHSPSPWGLTNAECLKDGSGVAQKCKLVRLTPESLGMEPRNWHFI